MIGVVTAGAATLVGTPLHAAAGVVIPPIPTVTIQTGGGGGGVGVPGIPNETVYTLTLSASETNASSGDTVTLTATASPDFPSNFHIDIDQYNQLVTPQINGEASCPSNPCVASFSNPSGQFTYQAYLDDQPWYGGQPPDPTSLVAVSNPVTVTWSSATMPSQDCAGTPTLNGDQLGVTYMLNSEQVGTQTTWCFRVDDTLAGGAVGGALVVNTGETPGRPSTVAGDQCVGRTDNDITELPHPLSSQQVNGQTVWYVDIYQGPASNGDYWVCLEAAGTAETVDVPVSIGTLIPSVTFYPDPDSLVQ